MHLLVSRTSRDGWDLTCWAFGCRSSLNLDPAPRIGIPADLAVATVQSTTGQAEHDAKIIGSDAANWRWTLGNVSPTKEAFATSSCSVARLGCKMWGGIKSILRQSENLMFAWVGWAGRLVSTDGAQSCGWLNRRAFRAPPPRSAAQVQCCMDYHVQRDLSH